ncbi:MAG: tetratricopeptide repeat protein [Gammaproteobacteria bacterium]
MKNNKIRLALLALSLAGSLVLASCETDNSSNSSNASASFQQGKMAFQQQNYRKAFVTLKPLAQAGNADAQYAVGYMYYYGKGVVEDRAAAKYWIGKAADQGNVAARNQLAKINS